MTIFMELKNSTVQLNCAVFSDNSWSRGMVNVDNRELTNKKRLAYYMRAAFMSYELSLFTFFIHLSARLLLSRSTCFIKQLDLAINDACHAYAFIYGVADTTYRVKNQDTQHISKCLINISNWKSCIAIHWKASCQIVMLSIVLRCYYCATFIFL